MVTGRSGSAFVEHGAGRVLGRLDVGLVERVDAEQRARQRDRDLPPHDLGAERRAAAVDRGGPEVDRSARVAQRGQRAVEAVGDEEAVGAVAVGRRERLAHHGQDPGAVLAGRLRDELLDPVAERAPRVDGELVATGPHAGSERGGEREPGPSAAPQRSTICTAPRRIDARSSPRSAAGSIPKCESAL